ncbi:pentatricopeptide repeat-containing protein At2g27800, mitochondrial [Nymphaea colorata]|nr:pentatricopeptide repeat-containing protein At2g27800, mitochondrial [Nymphaea colorata]
MDALADQVLANSCFHSEPVFTTIIYFYCEGRKLSKAVRVFKHMKNSKRLGCRPSLRTYNLLFNAMLSKGSNSYISHMYMQTMRCLFRQMVDDGVRPDIFTLNFMVRGYVSSMHLNDALRIFHQMEVVYSCQPNAYTYDHLIHGLCAQGRSINAKSLYREMVSRGHTPSAKAYSSLVNCLAISGEVDDAVRFMKEMIEKGKLPDLVTCRTILDEVCRLGEVEKAKKMLWELKEKGVLDGLTFKNLLYHLEDDRGLIS